MSTAAARLARHTDFVLGRCRIGPDRSEKLETGLEAGLLSRIHPVEISLKEVVNGTRKRLASGQNGPSIPQRPAVQQQRLANLVRHWDRSRLNRRCCMHYLTIVFIVWAVAATILLALLAYRSTLTRYEEDCLFLGDCNDHQHKEQETILARVRKVQPAVRVMTVTTCIMSAALVGTFIFQLVQQLNTPAS